jgi:Spy/CpxP family protein refolding chaperone
VKGNTIKKLVVAALILAGTLLHVNVLFAQQTTSGGIDQDIRLLRRDVRSARKQIVAANVPLTDTQAQKFWPLYEDYTAEMMKINDAKVDVIRDYAANYQSLADAQAENLIKKWTEADKALIDLRMKYIPIFERVLPGKTAARFFQVDRRIATMLDLQLASEIPLVEP